MDAALPDADTCYRAISARDARFDGRFFMAVRTTRIFCRPICPARTPRRANVDFYPSAAAALAEGFRPCRRCRPELAPALRHGNGAGALVAYALRELARQPTLALDTLASRMGISDRHLRRIFIERLGAPPIAVVHSHRVLLAKQLVEQTARPLTEIAFAAGFESVRRFNAAMREAYGMPPSSLRRSVPHPSNDGLVRLRLQAQPPYDWAGLLGFMGPRAFAGIERIADGRYARSFAIGDTHGAIEARALDAAGAIELVVHAPDIANLQDVLARARRLFDLDAQAGVIAGHLAADPLLAPLVKRHAGIRIPGAWDPFEIGVRAILGQQVSVKAATTLAARVVAAHGEPLDAAIAASAGVDRLFPPPATIAKADLAPLGIVKARARAISALAEAVDGDRELFTRPASLDALVAELTRLPGIGEWTAQYVAMRALGEPDAFPHGDLGLVKAYSALAGRAITSRQLTLAAQAWRPWRSYAAMLLWRSLSDSSGG